MNIGSWRAPALLTSLLLIAGCQSTAARSNAAVGGRETTATVTAMEQPDREATFPEIPSAVPSPGEFVAAPRLAAIHFEFDASEIRSEDIAVLDENAAWLKANPNTLVLIEGHSGERGTSEYNLALGERRAVAAMNYLIDRGVRAGRLVSISYGKEHPLCTDHDEACWAQNRRALFLVKPL